MVLVTMLNSLSVPLLALLSVSLLIAAVNVVRARIVRACACSIPQLLLVSNVLSVSRHGGSGRRATASQLVYLVFYNLIYSLGSFLRNHSKEVLMFRKRMSRSKSRSSFRKGASRVHSLNSSSGSKYVMRGGIRL